ncbi:hypothetical protein NECID01_1790 [Nematocida sp. AWRm77]|nr:hypothetical protein NECID01_1790 [Nematocida sp. AWRm77]
MVQKERSSLIQMLNTSIGSLSGLFKGKKEDEEGDVEIEEIQTSQEKEAQSAFVLSEEQEFEKEMSNISVSFETPSQTESSPEERPLLPPKEPAESDSKKTETENEIHRLRKILALKEEIRMQEREKEREAIDLKALELIKVQAHLEYEKKQRKVLEQEMQQIRSRLEQSELECMELIKYCWLLLDAENNVPKV